MIIVNVEDYFHPSAGYQVNVLSKYLKEFGHEVYIITSEMDLIPDYLTSFFGKSNIDELDKEYEKNTGVKIIRVPILKYISGRAIFHKKIYSIIKKLNPDLIFAHGNDTHTGMQLIRKNKKIGVPLITDNHMLEMASKNPLRKLFRLYYKLFITPIIVKNNIIVIKTQNDDYVNKCLGIPKKFTPWISYGSDTLLFHPDNAIREEFRKKNNIDNDALVFLYAGKLDNSKGGLFFSEAIKDKIISKRKIVFLIVGAVNGEYGNKIEKNFNESKNIIIRYATQRYVDLAKFYQASDIALFPKQCSLSFYDVQACGLPVLSEDNNINVDRNSYNNGWNFKSGNHEDFRKKIEYISNLSDEELKYFSRNAFLYVTKNYDYREKAKEYESILIQYYNERMGEKNE